MKTDFDLMQTNLIEPSRNVPSTQQNGTIHGTILIVEDEENDAFFLQTALQKAGLRNPVYLVENGRLALDYLSGAGEFANRKMYPLPSVVFLDLKLPQVNGLAILKWIREQPSLPSILVVVLTASRLDEDIERAYRLGANSYVVKPSRSEGTTPELQHNSFFRIP